MSTGRSASAEPYFQAIAENTGTPEAKLTLAQYYILVDRSDDARRVLQEVAKRDDGYAAATVRIAALDAAQGQMAAAQSRVREVLVKYPKDIPAHLLNANLLLLDRKRDEALSAVNAALASDPNSARAHFLAGRILEAGDRLDEAIKSYEQVLKLDPQPLAAALQLANSTYGWGQPIRR